MANVIKVKRTQLEDLAGISKLIEGEEDLVERKFGIVDFTNLMYDHGVS